ncbi:MAG: hypothetical protein HOP04_11625 [Methylophilaceae bacterium]|nr:hypothetical protein [Methylophilaceae bacterium]
MSEWRELTLNQITEPVKSTYLPKGDEQLAYIGLEHIEQETLRLTGVGKSSDVTSNKFKFETNDVLFGKLRPYFRKVYKPKFSGICSTDIWVFRAKKGFVQDYLFYFLASWDFVDTANSGEGGTRMPRADWNFLKSTSWLVPCEEEQKAIASVLSSLDDKIDLLHRQNTTLERMAETLFRLWFVEEAQEVWEEVPLRDVCSINNGYAFQSETYRETGQKIIRTMNFNNHWIEFNSLVYISEELARSFGKFYLRRNDFLLVMVGASLGNFAIVTDDVIPSLQNQNMWCFRSDENIFQHYLNFALRNIINDALNGASGSAREFFQKGVFYEIKIQIPPNDLIQKFHNISESYFSKIELNRKQIKTLENLRDNLLPKLMSGDVRVRDD